MSSSCNTLQKNQRGGFLVHLLEKKFSNLLKMTIITAIFDFKFTIISLEFYATAAQFERK